MTTDSQAPLPERIGPYRIERFIGQGGMGTVYYGVHADSGEPAAVKVLAASMASHEGLVRRFNREIMALQKVSNEHIVKLFESGVDGDTYYYAMEYVDGETLTRLLERDERLPWQTVIDYGIQICSALKSAHDAGVIHRDLKPGNLLVTADGVVKLADFGVAQVFAESKLTVTGGIVGTAEYMSPEQARGVRVTRKSDLYSLGAVLYAMLVGRPPFSGSATVDILHKHQYGQFEKISRIITGVPSWLDELVSQLLEKDPAKRPPDAHVVGRRLQEIVKKVEISQGQETRASTREFAAEGDELAGVGPTLMRDLVRSEIERAHGGHGGGLLDNVWVLSALLGLVILGGVWWFKWRAPDPDELFARGEDLMSEREGGAWLIARDECFMPLLKLDHDTWHARVQPYMDQIEDFERRREDQPVGRKLPRRAEPESRSAELSEPQRLLRLARSQFELGETQRAAQTLDALITVIRNDDDSVEVLEQATQLLIEIRTAGATRTRKFLARQLERLEELEQSGRADDAQQLRESLELLYGSTPVFQRLQQEAETAP